MTSVIFLTYGGHGLPHINEFVEHNPDIKYHVADGGGLLEGQDKLQVWRNCDRQIRDYWKENSYLIEGDTIVTIEYDVFINQKLPDIKPVGLVGKDVKTNDSWCWWNEKKKLGIDECFAVGLAPLAVIFWNRKVLDAIIDPCWDEVFNKDIFCELRLPSVAHACGYYPEECDMPHLHDIQTVVLRKNPGIYHSVKDRRLICGAR